MLTIYHKSNSNRNKEAKFFQSLLNQFLEAEVVSKNYPINPNYLNCTVDCQHLISRLQNDALLPEERRRECIKKLKELPSQLKVVVEVSNISFDFVIDSNRVPYFFEFHEEQHRNLKDSRIKNVYTKNGEPLSVPRYLHRLIRDVWRVQLFLPYTIVWWDWFANNESTYKPALLEGYNEFFEPGKFSFKNFLEIVE